MKIRRRRWVIRKDHSRLLEECSHTLSDVRERLAEAVGVRGVSIDGIPWTSWLPDSAVGDVQNAIVALHNAQVKLYRKRKGK